MCSEKRLQMTSFDRLLLYRRDQWAGTSKDIPNSSRGGGWLSTDNKYANNCAFARRHARPHRWKRPVWERLLAACEGLAPANGGFHGQAYRAAADSLEQGRFRPALCGTIAENGAGIVPWGDCHSGPGPGLSGGREFDDGSRSVSCSERLRAEAG